MGEKQSLLQRLSRDLELEGEPVPGQSLIEIAGDSRILVENQIDHLLYDSFFEVLNRSDCVFSGAEPCLRRYASSFYAGGVSSVARQYAQDGCSASEEHLEQLLMQLFTGSLFK